ncbi:glycolate oxidase FAD binding subunit [Asanoa hainanensis]|uniref:Glycolate oxidase FAD binding subunit n=1 Tax=Asanoa hainanensis TaxID=560556 RepID=A0A239NQL5_9ACTN|nr:FAD-binding oxidoreductase [Asanoa hainanensis]SNT56763.1 glycolate oxidase FAD binding subunit [Asanoa hainanensis]
MSVPGGFDVRRRLASICGEGFAREAGPADDVIGVPARWVAAPGTVEAASAVLALAAAEDLAVVPRGAATKVDWGAPPARLDLLIDTGRLAGIWHRDAGELSVEVGAGTPVRAVQAALGQRGHRLACDPRSIGATLGGILAADEAGPLRHRYGTPCEQVVGVSYVDAEGRLHHSSGWSMRGADGPGLNQLLCGSQGALALLVSATLRTQAAPAARVWVTRSVWTPLEVHDLVRQALAAAVAPSAVEVDLPAHRAILIPRQRSRQGPGTVALLLEGSRADVIERAEQLVLVLGGDARALETPPRWWHRYPFEPGEVALRLSVPISDLHAAIYALRDAVGGPVPVRGAAGIGVVHAALPASLGGDRVSAILTAVRGVLLFRGGTCVVTSAPPAVRQAIDMWGPVAALPTLREVKERFDPQRRMAPGRYIGGL